MKRFASGPASIAARRLTPATTFAGAPAKGYLAPKFKPGDHVRVLLRGRMEWTIGIVVYAPPNVLAETHTVLCEQGFEEVYESRMVAL